MNSLLAVAALLSVAAITPGPNNLVVLRAAAHGGFVRTLPAVISIVLGSIALLATVVAGAGAALIAWPALGAAISTAGALYLVWLGLRMIMTAHAEGLSSDLPAGIFGLFLFQFLNPKGWVMVLSVVTAVREKNALDTFVRLAPLFACIPAICLLLWAALGTVLSGFLARPTARRWTDRVLGALLAIAAVLLLI